MNKIKSAIMGAIVGDAVGVPFEFRSNYEMAFNPCYEMTGHGTYNKPAGTWSDDSSMVLATLDALENNSFNLDKMMLNFLDWQTSGKYTQDGFMFDIGLTTRLALNDYRTNVNTSTCGQNTVENNGNGALMRIIPVALYLFNNYGVNALKEDKNVQLVNNISALTHAHSISKTACLIYVSVALHLLNDEGKQGILDGLNEAKVFVKDSAFDRLYSKNFFKLKLNDLSGKGYVVSTLESALYICYTTKTFKESILTAVNLGDDTDTTASVVGGLTGILYGFDNIEKEWIDGIRNKELVYDLIDKFNNNLAK